MTSNSTTPCLPQSETETAVHLFDSWFDPIEAGLRDRVRDFLHAMFEGELDVLLSPPGSERFERQWRERRRRRQRPPPRPPVAVPHGELWPGGDRGAARATEHPGRQND